MEKRAKRELVEEIRRLKRVNLALINRVERDLVHENSAMSIFTGNVLFSELVNKQTAQLQTVSCELTKEKERVKKILRSFSGGVFTIDKNFKIQDQYRNFLDKNIINLILNKSLSTFKKSFRNKIQIYFNTRSLRESVTFEFHLKFQNKEYFLSCSLTKIDDNHYSVFITDKTDSYLKNKLIEEQENQLNQLSRLSTIGELVANIAHEINTPLCTMLIAAEQIHKISKNLELHDIEEISGHILETTRQTTKIIQGLKSMCQGDKSNNYEWYNLNDLFTHSLDMCRWKYKYLPIKMDICSENDIYILAKKTEFIQVLVNLLNNSCQAIANQRKPWIRFESQLNNDGLDIYITDSGKGIKRSDVVQLFTSFFTTKSEEELEKFQKVGD